MSMAMSSWFVVGVLVGYAIHALQGWAERQISPWLAARVAAGGAGADAEPAGDLQVGDVREYESEGYLYRSIVRRLHVRRGVHLVSYQMWRDDNPEPTDDGRFVWEHEQRRFLGLYTRVVERRAPQRPAPVVFVAGVRGLN